MHPKGIEGRRNAEKDATQSIAGQPRDDEDEESLEQPERVPSHLTARELQFRDRPSRDEASEDTGERHGSASFEGSRGEPAIDDDEPPRGERGLPQTRSDEALEKHKGRKPS